MTDKEIVTKRINDNSANCRSSPRFSRKHRAKKIYYVDENNSRDEATSSATATVVHTADLSKNLRKDFPKINIKLISEDLLKQFQKCQAETLTPILGQLKRLKKSNSKRGKSARASSFNSRFTFLVTFNLLPFKNKD